MRYCKKCLMPDTRPGITFVDGECAPCINYAKQKTIDWDVRKKELEKLCDKSLYLFPLEPHREEFLA